MCWRDFRPPSELHTRPVFSCPRNSICPCRAGSVSCGFSGPASLLCAGTPVPHLRAADWTPTPPHPAIQSSHGLDCFTRWRGNSPAPRGLCAVASNRVCRNSPSSGTPGPCYPGLPVPPFTHHGGLCHWEEPGLSGSSLARPVPLADLLPFRPSWERLESWSPGASEREKIV